MSLALELEPDKRATLEQIWKERQAKGQARPPMTLPPESKPEPASKQAPGTPAERRNAFLAAVRAKFPDGSSVTKAAASEASGVPMITVGDYIQHFKSRGEWPFLQGRRGPAAKAKPTIPDFDLPASKVTPKPRVEPPPAPRVVPPPVVAVEPKPKPTPAGSEAVEFIEAAGLNYHLGSAVECIAAGDAAKARWHLDREIARREREGAAS